MNAILLKPIRYYTFECQPVELDAGTVVRVDTDDNTACFNGDHFDVEPDEWDQAPGLTVN